MSTTDVSIKREFFSLPSQFLYKNYVLDVHNSTNRKHAAQFILSLFTTSDYVLPLLTIYSHKILIDKRWSPRDSQLLSDILSFEWINNQTALCSSFSSITSKLIKIKNNKQQQLLQNLNSMIDILTYNRLILKYILQSNNCKIWKPCLSSMITAILLNIPNSPKELFSANYKYIGDHPWVYCVATLSVTIPYWTSKQYIFAVNNGLCKILRICWMNKLYVPCYRSIHQNERVPDKNLSCSLYQTVYCYARKLDRKNGTDIRLYFMRGINEELKNSNKFYLNYLCDIKLLRAAQFEWDIFEKMVSIKCGWLLCNKRKSQFERKNKCRGC